MTRILLGSHPVQLDERPTIDELYRWQARLKGRSCGGYLVGTGPTPLAAIEKLEQSYVEELDSVRRAKADVIRAFTAPRARK